jgi:hypothetical protein
VTILINIISISAAKVIFPCIGIIVVPLKVSDHLMAVFPNGIFYGLHATSVPHNQQNARKI